MLPIVGGWRAVSLNVLVDPCTLSVRVLDACGWRAHVNVTCGEGTVRLHGLTGDGGSRGRGAKRRHEPWDGKRS